MLIVYADSSMEDVQALRPVSMEFAFGSDENDFQVVMPKEAPRLDAHGYIYVDGTEYGGMVDNVAHDEETDQMAYTGATWHGLLEGKVICPPNGSDYRSVSGTVNAAISSVLKAVGLDSVMKAADTSGVSVSYRFNRYTDAYSGLRAMLATVGRTLAITCSGGTVEVSSAPTRTLDARASTEVYGTPVNHLICLGKGELSSRTVIHLYADAKGNVGTTQTLKGALERTDVYDYSNAEADELRQKGIERLSGYQVFRKADLLDLEGVELHVDDVLAAYDSVTGVSTSEPVTKVIASFDRLGFRTVKYESGDSKASATDY